MCFSKLNLEKIVLVSMNDAFARASGKNIQLRLIFSGCSWSHFNIMEQTISLLTTNTKLRWALFFDFSFNLNLFFVYFKNVIFIEQPSAAPTPLSRRIFCACTKFGALSNALVMKCRAKCLQTNKSKK